MLTFYQFPESQWLSLRTTNAIERMQLEFRRRVKNAGGVAQRERGATGILRVISGQMKLRRIKGYRDIQRKEKPAA